MKSNLQTPPRPSPPPSAHNPLSCSWTLLSMLLSCFHWSRTPCLRQFVSVEPCGMTHLSQCALHWAQEVGLLQAIQAAAVDVVQLEAQTLHLFKIKVQCENLGVGGVDAAANHLSAVHLQDTQRTDKTEKRHHEVHLRAMTSLPAHSEWLTAGFRRCLGLVFIRKEHQREEEVKVVKSNCPPSVLLRTDGVWSQSAEPKCDTAEVLVHIQFLNFLWSLKRRAS